MTGGWLARQKAVSRYKVCIVTEAARLVGNCIARPGLYRDIGSLASREVSCNTAQGRALVRCDTTALTLRHDRLAYDKAGATATTWPPGLRHCRGHGHDMALNRLRHGHVRAAWARPVRAG